MKYLHVSIYNEIGTYTFTIQVVSVGTTYTNISSVVNEVII